MGVDEEMVEEEAREKIINGRGRSKRNGISL